MEEITRTAAVAPADEEQTITLTDLINQIKARWSWFIVSTAITIIVAVLYLMHATPMYTRTSEILLKDDSSQSFSGDLSMLGVNSVPASILNEMFILQSPELMSHVVETLGINETYTTPDGLRSRELYHCSPVMVQAADSASAPQGSFGFRIELADDGKSFELDRFTKNGEKISGEAEGQFGVPVTTPVGTIAIYPTKFMTEKVGKYDIPTTVTYAYVPVKGAARTYCGRLKAEYMEDRGDVISLSIDCETPQKASDVLISVVNTYNELWVDERGKIAKATSSFIDDRLATIEAELGDVESTISDFKSSHRMMDMDAMAQIYVSQSTENQRQLNQLAQDMAIAKFIKKELAANDVTRLLPVTAEIGGTNIQQLVTAYNTAVAERNVKLLTMPEDSPIMQQKTTAIMNQRDAILASIETALESLNSRYKAIELIDRKTQDQLATAPGQAKYLMSEERKQKVKESLYVFLLQRREENELSQAFTAYNIRMVTEPFGSGKPTSPKTMMVLMVAIVIGLLIPVLLIYINEVMNTRVRSRKDIDELPIPFMGEIPMADDGIKMPRWLRWYRARHHESPSVRPLMVGEHTDTVTAEAFRMVRTNMDFMRTMQDGESDGKARVVMVVSLNAGSGKTFVCLNTAASYAIKGKKVCLVDFDLRKGTVSQNAGNPRHGITDFLVGKTDDVNTLIVHNIDGLQGFDILPEGIHPPNPTELLYGPRLDLLFEQLRAEYDYIFLDCPPVEIVADARILNPYCDMTLFVMRAGLFERSDLPELASFYTTKRYKNLALVLNATDKVHGVYGHYGYGYKPRKPRKGYRHKDKR